MQGDANPPFAGALTTQPLFLFFFFAALILTLIRSHARGRP